MIIYRRKNFFIIKTKTEIYTHTLLNENETTDGDGEENTFLRKN